MTDTTTTANPHGHGRPSDWVERFLSGITSGGTLLDVACGAGRHLRRARALGHPVVGLDRDTSALADLAHDPATEIVAHDLEIDGGLALPFAPERRFAAIVVTNYLFLPLFPVLRTRLAADGLLIWETFALGQERYGKPSNPRFLLGANELLSPELIEGLVVVGFEQGEVPAPLTVTGAPKIVQRLAAVGPAHPWARTAPRSLGPA